MEQRRSGRQKCSKGGEKLIRISQLKLPITHTKAQLEKKIAKTLKNPGNSFTYEIKKQSLDCRHKNDKIFVYTVDVTIRDEQKLAKKVNNNNIMLTKEKPYEFPGKDNLQVIFYQARQEIYELFQCHNYLWFEIYDLPSTHKS